MRHIRLVCKLEARTTCVLGIACAVRAHRTHPLATDRLDGRGHAAGGGRLSPAAINIHRMFAIGRPARRSLVPHLCQVYSYLHTPHTERVLYYYPRTPHTLTPLAQRTSFR